MARRWSHDEATNSLRSLSSSLNNYYRGQAKSACPTWTLDCRSLSSTRSGFECLICSVIHTADERQDFLCGMDSKPDSITEGEHRKQLNGGSFSSAVRVLIHGKEADQPETCSRTGLDYHLYSLACTLLIDKESLKTETLRANCYEVRTSLCHWTVKTTAHWLRRHRLLFLLPRALCCGFPSDRISLKAYDYPASRTFRHLSIPEMWPPICDDGFYSIEDGGSFGNHACIPRAKSILLVG